MTHRSIHPLCLINVLNCMFTAVTKHTNVIAKCNSDIHMIQISAGLSNLGHGISSHFDGDELKNNLIPQSHTCTQGPNHCQ